MASKIPSRAPLRLLRASDGADFSFLAGPNFEVIKAYNHSNSFAVAVGTLATEIMLRV